MESSGCTKCKAKGSQTAAENLDEKARKEAAVKKEAAEKARKEAEEKLRKEAEEKAGKEAEDKGGDLWKKLHEQLELEDHEVAPLVAALKKLGVKKSEHLAILKSSDIKELPLNRVQAILFEKNFTKGSGSSFGGQEKVVKLLVVGTTWTQQLSVSLLHILPML